MRSKIHLKGHPLHPILVGFPIAFFFGTLLFDILGFWKQDQSYQVTAGYLEISGIVFTILAAIPGIMDYAFILPPNSSAKKRGAKHGILNIIVLIIFTGVCFYRHNIEPSKYIIISGEAIGVAIIGISGWLGGTLVHRNQIGVDHRYSGAGKYKEKYLGDRTGEIEIMSMDELQTDQMMLIHINKKRIVIGKTENEFVAFSDWCSHRGGSLADGVMICGTVQCPWHGSQFDCKSGKVKAGPAKDPIMVYKLLQRDNKVFISI